MNNLFVDTLIARWLRQRNIERPFTHRTAPQLTTVNGVLTVEVDIEVTTDIERLLITGSISSEGEPTTQKVPL